MTVAELHNAKNVRIIDIRKNPDDYQIPASERYNGEALSSAENLPFDKSEEVVIYCGSGNSCSVLAQQLRDRGYTKAVALDGGYAAWKAAGLPLEAVRNGATHSGENRTG
ncbi:MAG: rhodanese-like domain-containing protein [Candidatus Eremiobacteraeota bacterium]|nr:rhodanese-like domain-containing protein [Candidatus Eremiobacteraeota bacterium]